MFANKIRSKTNSDIEGSLSRLVELRRDAPSRFKHLKYVLDANPDPVDRRQVFLDYSFEIFHLFEELLCIGEYNPPNANIATSSRPHSELDYAFWILEHILVSIPDKIHAGLQWEAIHDTIRRAIHPHNHVQTRKIGLRCFFLWYQIVCISYEGSIKVSGSLVSLLDRTFSVLVPYFPIPSSTDGSVMTSTEKVLFELCSVAGGPFVPVQVEKIVSIGTSQLRQSFLERLLYGVVKEVERINWPDDSRSMHVKCLEMLLDKVCQYYMTAYFPCPLPTLDIYNYTESILPHPPHFTTPYSPLSVNDPIVMCRAAVVHWIAGYAIGYSHLGDQTSNAKIVPSQIHDPRVQLPPNYDLMRLVLFSRKRNVNLVLSILKEGLMLPLQCSKVMSRVFRIIREWMLLVEMRPFMEEPSNCDQETAAGLENSLVVLTEILLSFYFSPYLPIEKDKLSTAQEVNQRIQGLLRILINSPTLAQAPFTQKLWVTLLGGVRVVVERVMPIVPPNLGIDCPQQYCSMVATSLLYTLLLAWVMATGLNRLSLPDTMWDSLVSTLQSRTAWIDVVEQWAQVINGITRAIGLHCFGVDLQDPPLERLSEQKMKKMAGQSRIQLVNDKSSTTSAGDFSTLAVNGNQFDFIGTSPIATSPMMESNSIMTSSEVSPALGQRVRVPSYPIQQFNPGYERISSVEGCDGMRNAETVSLEGSASLDSTSLALSGEGGARSNVIFGVDRDSSTPSPPASAADDDQVPTSFHDLADMTRIEEMGSHPLSPSSFEDGLSYAETWMLVWKRMLGCLGDLDTIQDARIHSKAVQVFVNVADMLIQIRENQGVGVDGVDCVPPRVIPPMDSVIPYLLKASKPHAQRYNSSCTSSIRALCKIYLRRPTDTPVKLENLAKFTCLMHSTLNSCNISNCDSILQELVPQILYIGAEKLEPDNHAQLLGSTCTILVRDCLKASQSVLECENVDHTSAARFISCLSVITVCQWGSGNYASADFTNLPSSQVFLQCQNSLLTAFNSNRLNVEARSFCLSCLCCLLYLMHKQSHENTDVAVQIEREIVETIQNGDTQFALMAVQCTSPLIGVARKSTSQNLMQALISRFSLAKTHSFSSDTCAESLLLQRILCELGEWCLAYMPEDTLPTIHTLFSAFDSPCQPVHSSALLAIALLTRCFRQFPPTPFSITHLSSTLVNPTFIAATSNHILWSVEQDQSSKCSFSSTHIGGHNRWDMDCVQGPSIEKMSKADSVHISARDWLLDDTDSANEVEVDRKIVSTDGEAYPLERMCFHISATSKECLPDSAFPHIIPECNSKEEQLITVNMKELANAEVSRLPLPSQSVVSWNSGHPCDVWRQLIASVGLIGWEQQKYVLGKNYASKDENRLQREISHLNKQNVRETHKVAVIFVGPGQEDKESILSNSSASTAFENFVAGLGWEVDLAVHSGYTGGLSAKEEPCTCPYYACAAYEILFHVSTRLPLGEHIDTRKRLRHIGNDEVVVVWSEHNRDYRKNIIPTQFADVLIVLYPIQDGLCRVSITGHNATIGPLFDGCIIPLVYLPSLLRVTVVNCGRAKRSGMIGWTETHEQRLSSLNHLLTNFAPPTTFANMLRSIYTPIDPASTPKREVSKSSFNQLDPGEVVMV